MTFIVSLYFIEVLGDKDVDLKMPIFWKDLEKVHKTFFQSIWAKKNKIVDKMNRELFISDVKRIWQLVLLK
jgi:hypothetical protein